MSTEAVLVAPKPVAGISVRRAKEDPAWVRWGLTIFAIAVVAILVVIPVVNIFAEALSDGLGAYWRNLFSDPDTRHSIMLTLIVGPIALVANLILMLHCPVTNRVHLVAGHLSIGLSWFAAVCVRQWWSRRA